jgi:predicted nucleic acid-binding protein
MKIFLDTSSLFKLYHQEAGTAELEQIFALGNVTHVFLSELTKVEFASTVWKKVRTKEITAAQANATVMLFEADFAKYTFATTDSLLLEQARQLVIKYGLEGLRTLDSIQLATCLLLAQEVAVFFTADKLLKTLLGAEGLPTELPVR